MAHGEGPDPIAGGRCPRCEATLVGFESGLSTGTRCDRCGWSVATTNPKHPLFDRSLYDLRIEVGETDRKAAIARTAAALGTDLRWTRTRVDSGQPVVQGASLTETAALRRRLVEAGLRVRVRPDPPVPLEEIDAMTRQPPPGRCDVCGRPGEPVAHPSAPVTTGTLCAEHAAEVSSFNPVPMFFWLLVLGLLAAVVLLVWWLGS